VKKTLFSFLAAVFGVQMTYGYDIHHPDPMAILNGHHFSSPRAKPDEKTEDNAIRRLQPERMYRRHKESKYIIKPEPFSIKSKKNDPELLGPQRTFSADGNSSRASQNEKSPEAKKVQNASISRDQCITLIGQEKFDSYVEKYGSVEGALKRCLILKRMRG